MVLQKLKDYPKHSDISIVGQMIPRGSMVQINIAEGVLHAIGAAAQSARGQPQF
jgi:hypothetical protein